MKPAKAKPLTEKDLATLAKLHAAALTPQLLDIAERRAGISRTTLEVFGVGYSSEYGRYSFPMVDGARKLVGFALWAPDAKPGIVPGSGMGLFLPSPCEVVDCPIIDGPPQTLVLPQGPIDAAFVRDIGFMGVIGRPAATSGIGHVPALLATLPPQEAIVVLPGGRGTPGYAQAAGAALAIMESLMSRPDGRVRLWKPPDGKLFREVVTDFPSMAVAVLTAVTMTAQRIKGAKWKLSEIEKGRAA